MEAVSTLGEKNQLNLAEVKESTKMLSERMATFEHFHGNHVEFGINNQLILAEVKESTEILSERMATFGTLS